MAVVWLGLSAYGAWGADAGDRPWGADLALTARALARIADVGRNPSEVERLAAQVAPLVGAASTTPLATADVAYQIRRLDGTLLASQASLPPLPAGGLAPYRFIELPGWVAYAAESPRHDAYAVAAVRQAAVTALEPSLLDALLKPYALLAGLLAVCLWPAVSYGVRPLARLSRQLAARAPSDLEPIVTRRSYRELAPLIAALNALLGRIQRMRAAEREFFADAAHELRTPLAAIGAQAHVVAREQDPVARRAAARALEQGIARARRVLDRLLTLARLDAASGLDAPQSVDLRDLAEAAVALFAERAAVCGQALRVTAQAVTLPYADRELLESALHGLIDNAIRYTPAGTTIRVFVDQRAGAALLAVEDDGPGIPAAASDRVFERFERLDAADTEGSGLGLAIVRRVAELHGGTARLGVPGSGRGCRFELALPLAR